MAGILWECFCYIILCETVGHGKSETEAAELAGLMTGWSDRTAQDWKAHFYESDSNNIPESKQV